MLFYSRIDLYKSRTPTSMNTFLDFISKKLKIDAHYLYKGFLWMGISTFFIFGLSFAKSYVFANYLRPETFGTYRYIMTVIEVTSALSLTGISLVISRSVAQGFEGTYLKGISSYLKHSYLASLSTIAVALYYAFVGNYLFAFTIAFAGMLSIGVGGARLYGALFEGKKRNDLTARFQMIATAIPTLAIIGIVFISESLFVIILTYFVTLLITHTCLSFTAYKIIQPNKIVDAKATGFTFHLSVMSTISMMVEHLDKLLLFQFLGPAQLAMYTFAAAIPEQFNVVGKSLRALIYPKISEQSIASTRKHILNKSFLIFIACLVMYLGYILTAPFIFHTFFNQYTDAILLSQVYALSIFLIITTPYRAVLLAHSCTRELYHTKIILIVSRIGLLCIFLPLFGVWGVITSYLIARYVEMGMYMYAVHFGLTKYEPTKLAIEKQIQVEPSLEEL